MGRIGNGIFACSAAAIVLGAAVGGRAPAKGDADVPSAARVATDYPGADIGAKVNAAIQTCPRRGCRVEIPGGLYLESTTIVIDRPVWLVGEGAGATEVNYRGAGAAVLVEAGSAPPYLNGEISDLTIDGSGSQQAIGVWQVDTVGFRYDGLAVENFETGFLLDNEPPSFCAQCASGDNERTSFGKISVFLDGEGIVFATESGANNSFGYTRATDVHFQIPPSGVGLEVRGGSVLYNSALGLRANVAAPSTFIWVTSGSVVTDVVCDAAGEAPGPSQGIVFLRVDAGSTFYAYGRCHEAWGHNEVAPGARFAIGVELAGAAGTGDGALVLARHPIIESPVFLDPTLKGALVPRGEVLSSRGIIDAGGGGLIAPDVIQTESGGAVGLPSVSDELVARNTPDTLTNKTLLAPSIETPTIDGEAVLSPVHPAMTFFLPGRLDRRWVAAEWQPDYPEVLTGVSWAAKTGASACAVPADLSLRQAGHILFTSEVRGSAGGSGPINVGLASGFMASLGVETPASCPGGTSPADVTVVLQFRSGSEPRFAPPGSAGQASARGSGFGRGLRTGSEHDGLTPPGPKRDLRLLFEEFVDRAPSSGAALHSIVVKDHQPARH